MSKELQSMRLTDSLLAVDKFAHYIEVSKQLSTSDLVPKAMKNKPMDVLVAMEMGYQLGIPMLQAIQDIAVISGRPCMYGDGLLAVVQAHPDYEWIKEEPILTTNVITGYSCTIKRKNHEPHTKIFTLDDARKAGLITRSGPWMQYPSRMLQMRARGFAIRDIFADALRGIKPAEEIQDYFDTEVVDAQAGDESTLTQTERLKKSIKARKKLNEEDAQELTEEENVHEGEAVDSENSDTVNPNTDSKVTAAEAESSENPDNKPEEIPTSAHISEVQINAIKTLIEQKKLSTTRVKNGLSRYNAAKIEELTAEQADNLISLLNRIS